MRRAPVAVADPDVLEAVAKGNPTTAIVIFDADYLAATAGVAPRAYDPQGSVQRAVRYSLAKQDLLAAAPASVTLLRDFERLPLTLVGLDDAEALAHVLADPSVARVVPDRLNQLHLAQSLAQIRQPQALAEGKDGTGVTVAVLDTGADSSNAALGSCTAPGVPSATCKVVYAQDFAPDDGLLDDASKHGTNVSSIVAGVAPGAKIIALDVFRPTGGYDSDIIAAINWVVANRATYNIAAMNLSLGGGSYTAPCPSYAMPVALAEARKAGVLAAVATGNSGTTNAISYPACAPAAVAVGAVYDANLGAIGYSACRDATTAVDQVTCFSNSASFMTLLAPGSLITAGGITMAGTSQATPHVAGAMGVLHGAFPLETPDELVARMVNSGTPVADARNGLTVPRLDLAAAAAGCVFKVTPAAINVNGDASSTALTLSTTSSCAWSVASDSAWLTVGPTASGTGAATLQVAVAQNTGALRSGKLTLTGDASTVVVPVTQGVDTSAPTGSVVINNGDALTRGRTVALAITAADPSGVASMCVSNTTGCSAWEPFATSKSWTLGTVQGVNTVRVFLKDGRGNASSAATAPRDGIILDSTPPLNPVVTGAYGDGSATLSWTAATDALSGVVGYRVVFAATTPPASCAVGTPVYEGPLLTATQTGLTNGVPWGFRVCALDGAGNLSAGATALVSPRPEADAPVGTVVINGDAPFTRTPAVTVTLAATDASAVSQVCVSTSTSCTAWQAWSTTRTLSLPAGQGVQTVRAWFRDQWGNTTATPATDTIVLDSVAPTNPVLTGAWGDGAASLSWTASTDATSGVASYRVVMAPTTAPANCTLGTPGYDGPALSITQSGLTNGVVVGFRVCAVDAAGNLSPGTATTVKPKPEADGPTGALTLNGGAAVTRTPVVTVALSATDASTVSQMCLSLGASCTAWQPFVPSRTFTLAAIQGVQTVSAWFRDEWGNTSAAPARASLRLDSLAPSNPVLTAASGDAQALLSWTASVDSGSGVAGYRVVAAPTSAPASCAAGTVVTEGPGLSVIHTGLTNGVVMGYRVCALDVAGNVSPGVVATVKPRPEADAPVGTVTLNGGAAWTRTTAVTVALTATDASTVAQVCLSATASCTAWQPFVTSKVLTLPAVQGLQTVRAWFRDEWGNTSAAPVRATIALDSLAPGAQAVTATPGSGQVGLSWAAATDSGSGVAGYKVVGQAGTVAPAAGCATGTALGVVASPGFTHTGLTAGVSWAWRVCPVDVAGNTGGGAVVTAKALP